ncbi:MAG: hypothetical protein HQL50_01795 [Magnetococcales bacterium]|nr:hypothetical protein [Magnetococcales bacterium]
MNTDVTTSPTLRNGPSPDEPVLWEGKGLDYERFAMDKLFRRLVSEYSISSVLELPAKGEKAMPSLYSLPFAAAGCRVTLANPVKRSLWAWHRLNLPFHQVNCPDISATGLSDASHDLVWNFMTLAQSRHKEALIREMVRLSRRHVMIIAVNRFNPGFFVHRLVHRFSGVPWTHGDVPFMNPFHTARFLREQGLTVRTVGVVDTPPYPDSLGFRDMKLHKMNIDLNAANWDSRTLDWMERGTYPLKLHLLYLAERLPLPLIIKMFYAHLFYVLAEKPV